MKFYSPKHKKTNNTRSLVKKISLPIATSVLFMMTITYWNNKNYGLALEYEGQQIATVKKEEIYENAKEMIRSQIPENEKHKISSVNPKIKIVSLEENEHLEQPEEVKNKIIEKSSSILTPAYGAYLEKKVIAISDKKENIENAMNEILKENESKFSDAKAEFEEKVEIKEGLFSNSEIENADKIKTKLESKVENPISYTVSDDDTVVSIAEKFGISPQALLESNGKTENDRIYPGNTLVIPSLDTLLHVKVVAKETVENEIPYETITNENPDILKGRTVVTQEGVSGKEQVTYNVTYLNGKEIFKEESLRQTLAEPIPQVQDVGTKVEEYIWPTPFTKNVTSEFGYRKDPFGGNKVYYHSGIDISKCGIDGTDIVASKAGTVKTAKLGNTGYGNHVIIDHGNGISTLYGHCKSLCVSVGDYVNQGDKIACVGSTGQSTGPHLHFEVRINDQKKDPRDYVK